MVQAKLPDVNSAIVRYRSEAISAFHENDYERAQMALGNIVALLPDKFKIKISTEEYLKQINEQEFMVCIKCKHENPSNQIKRWPLKLYGLDKLAAGRDHVMVWNCLECKYENRVEQSKKIVEKIDRPFYLGVIPDPPRKQIGIIDRISFPAEFRRWFAVATQEIESKIGIYRAEYVAQNPDEKDTFGNDEK